MASQEQKIRARRQAHLARRSGELVRPHTCECKDCPMHPGQPCKRGDHTGHKLEMHHPDHNKPLAVLFLCNVCHKIADDRTQMTVAVVEQALKLRAQGLSLAYTAKRLGVSIRTLRRHVDGRARIHIDFEWRRAMTCELEISGQRSSVRLASGSNGTFPRNQ